MKKILNFLKSKNTILEFKLTCPDKLIKLCQSSGIKVDTETMEIDGWQYDWWINCEYNNKKLLLSGSGYYGNGRLEKLD